MQDWQLRNVPERRRLFGVARIPKRDRGDARHLHMMAICAQHPNMRCSTYPFLN